MVFLDFGHHVIDDPRQFVRRGRDRFGSAQFGPHPAIKVPEIRLAMMERLSRHAKCCGGAIVDFTGSDRQHFSTVRLTSWELSV